MFERFFPASTRDVATLAAEILGRGRGVRIPVCGRSMLPTLWSGDLVTVAPIDRWLIRPGDIVLLCGPRPVIHRVRATDRRAGTVTTRGDASLVDDAPRDLSTVLGRVVRIERPWRPWSAKVRQWAVWMRTRLGAGQTLFPKRRIGDMLRKWFFVIGSTAK